VKSFPENSNMSSSSVNTSNMVLNSNINISASELSCIEGNNSNNTADSTKSNVINVQLNNNNNDENIDETLSIDQLRTAQESAQLTTTVTTDKFFW
jgi:hypothetical protein